MPAKRVIFARRSRRYGPTNIDEEQKSSGYCLAGRGVDDKQVKEHQASHQENWFEHIISVVSRTFWILINSLLGLDYLSKLFKQVSQTSTDAVEDERTLVPMNSHSAKPPAVQITQSLVISGMLALGCDVLFHMDPKDRSRVLGQCRRDIAAALLGLAWFVSTCVLYPARVPRSLSDSPDGYLTLQDMFGFDVPIPLAMCSDYAKLRYHLCAQYVHSPAEAFLASDKFNIKDRSGRVIRKNHWTKMSLKATVRLIVAVVIETEISKCPYCMDSLSQIKGREGNYYCTQCKRSFRECDTLKEVAEIRAEMHAQVSHPSTEVSQPPPVLEGGQILDQIEDNPWDQSMMPVLKPIKLDDAFKNVDLQFTTPILATDTIPNLANDVASFSSNSETQQAPDQLQEAKQLVSSKNESISSSSDLAPPTWCTWKIDSNGRFYTMLQGLDGQTSCVNYHDGNFTNMEGSCLSSDEVAALKMRNSHSNQQYSGPQTKLDTTQEMSQIPIPSIIHDHSTDSMSHQDDSSRDHPQNVWTSWKKHSNGSLYRLIRGDRGKILCTHWQKTDKYYNENNLQITTEMALAIEQAGKRVVGRAPSAGAPLGDYPLSNSASKPLSTLVTEDWKREFPEAKPERKFTPTTWPPLSPEFQIRPAHFFQTGRVFRAVWIEPAGVSATSEGHQAYGTVRPFVVVKHSVAHCICAPIYSYNNRGVSKPGLKMSEIRNHAIIHMVDQELTCLEGEKRWESIMQMPFSVEPSSNQGLRLTSRLRFDMAYPVKFNLKVCDIGRIQGREQLDRLVACWREANAGN